MTQLTSKQKYLLELLQKKAKPLNTGELTWNSQQLRAIDYALQGKSFCLIGAAGTGKTTVVREIARRLQIQFPERLIQSSSKFLNINSPGIVTTAFTRRAISNIKKNLPADLAANALTAHALLEYEPEDVEVENPTTFEIQITRQFKPQRHLFNKLPFGIHTIFYEESSMLSKNPLYSQIQEALPNKPQEIFLGDINQLPPVYGESILIDKLIELPVIELTEVYRQALDSPIISLAHKIKDGESIKIEEKINLESPKQDSSVTIHPWKKSLHWEDAMQVISAFLKNLIKENLFDPESDVILTPQNINFGCIEMNKVMAQELGAKRGALVHEIVGGFLNHYFAVGDLVLHNKEDYIIEEITENPRYFGKPYVEPSVDLDRWGIHHGVGIKLNLKSFTTDADVDELLSKFSGESPDSEELRKKDSSHKLTLKHRDTGHRVTLTSAGDINSLLFGYAMTVHKAQGCEWNKVFLFLHSSQAVMQFRELIYTAVTRARNHLYIICEPDRGDKLNTLTKAASAPRIKGVTLEEKIDFITKRRKENELFHT